MRKFELKLPEALDVANRSLAAGHPLPAAISLVAREMPDPIGTEFGLLSDELTYGVTLDDALVNLADRVGVEDLNLLAISLSVQAGTGGNLVEILQNLSKTLRDRSMLKAKVRAISSEGRITAIFMSMYPFLLYAMIKILSPTYFDPVWESGHGAIVVTVLLAVMAIGNVILYKMVNFSTEAVMSSEYGIYLIVFFAVLIFSATASELFFDGARSRFGCRRARRQQARSSTLAIRRLPISARRKTA